MRGSYSAEASHHLSQVFESKHSTQNGICAVRTDGVLLFQNQVCRRDYGWIVQQVVDSFRGKGCLTPGLDEWVNRLKNGAEVFDYQSAFTYERENVVQVYMTASALQDEAVCDTSVVLFVFQDITNRIDHLERELDTAKLSGMAKMTDSMAHHIRNSLTSVRGFTQMFVEVVPREHQEYLQVMLSDIDWALGVVNDLMLLSLQEHPARRVMNLMSAVEQAVREFGRVKKHVQIRENYSHEEFLIFGDQTRLVRALFHILMNAADASEVNAAIDLEVGVSGDDTVYVACRDNGFGIPSEILASVDEPFHSMKTSGLGIGLAVVSQVVREHEGQLNITSKESGGTTVCIRLPSWKPACKPFSCDKHMTDANGF